MNYLAFTWRWERVCESNGCLLDFHENVGTRKLFHQASPTSLPSGHVITVEKAIIGISDLTDICLFVLMVPAVCQIHQAEKGNRGGLCIAKVEPPFSWLPLFQMSCSDTKHVGPTNLIPRSNYGLIIVPQSTNIFWGPVGALMGIFLWLPLIDAVGAWANAV